MVAELAARRHGDDALCGPAGVERDRRVQEVVYAGADRGGRLFALASRRGQLPGRLDGLRGGHSPGPSQRREGILHRICRTRQKNRRFIMSDVRAERESLLSVRAKPGEGIAHVHVELT